MAEPIDVEALHLRGHELIDAGDYAGALKVAAELEELRYTGAFEVGARAHAEQGELEVAIAILNRGLGLAPDAWANWQLLGNLTSDAGRFDDADAAYARALQCPGVWADSVKLNRAIAAERRGAFDEALVHLATMCGPELATHVADVGARVSLAAGRPEEAIATCAEYLAAEDAGGDTEARGRIVGTFVRARTALGQPLEESAALVRRYVTSDPNEDVALLTAWREVTGAVTRDGTVFRVMLTWSGTGDALGGFVRTAVVLADDADEAVAALVALQGAGAPRPVEADGVEVVERAVGGRKGVLAVYPMMWFEHDEH